MQGYRNQTVGELAKQLTAGLLRLRKGYVDAAEELLKLIQPGSEYPYEFVLYRLTGYRRRGPNVPLQPLSAESLRQDLQRLVLDLCASFALGADAYAEPAYDLEALCARFGVSVKTVQRWRRRGLVTRRLVFGDGKKRVGFLDSSVQAFLQRRREALRLGRFSQLSQPERQRIIRQARRLAARGWCLHDVGKLLAGRTGRAVETIRYTIRRHDRQDPQQAVFPAHVPPLDAPAKEVIHRCFLQGVPVPALARRYRRTRGSIYRIVNEVRARVVLGRKLEYMYNPQFDLPGAEDLILGEPAPQPPAAPAPRAPSPPEDLPPYLRSLYELPLLSPPQERRLFLQYNFLKYRADGLRKKLKPPLVPTDLVCRVERLLAQADAVKQQLVRANLRLVVSVAKRHLNGPQSLFELISDGNLSLMQAVEKFDCARGFKFSTYATWAIMKNFARSVPRERYLLERFVTGTDEVLELAATMRVYDPRTNRAPELRESLEVVLAQLAPRERSIIVRHFGLEESAPVQTLDQLSQDLGISKERVRQIERRAIDKLRAMLGPVQADLLA